MKQVRVYQDSLDGQGGQDGHDSQDGQAGLKGVTLADKTCFSLLFVTVDQRYYEKIV